MNYENWMKDQGCNYREELSLLQNVFSCQGAVQLTFVLNNLKREATYSVQGPR
jgi:hypothetical protein